MAAYTLKHFDASATRTHMEHIVESFNQNSSGQIKVSDYKIALLVVEAEDSVMDEFRKANPQWTVNKVAYAEVNAPGLNLGKIRQRLQDLDKK